MYNVNRKLESSEIKDITKGIKDFISTKKQLFNGVNITSVEASDSTITCKIEGNENIANTELETKIYFLVQEAIISIDLSYIKEEVSMVYYIANMNNSITVTPSSTGFSVKVK